MSAVYNNHPNIAIETPQDIEAERAVLGSILLDGDALHIIDLSAHDFYLERHAEIYKAMRRLSNHGTAIDYLALVGALKDAGKLDYIGGDAYLLGLVNATPTALNAQHYARGSARKRLLASWSMRRPR